MKRAKLIAGVLSGPALLLCIPTSPAMADNPCNPGRTPSSGWWYDGWNRSPGQVVGGVYSYLYDYAPYVYSGSHAVEYVQIGHGNVNASVGTIWSPGYTAGVFQNYPCGRATCMQGGFGFIYSCPAILSATSGEAVSDS